MMRRALFVVASVVLAVLVATAPAAGAHTVAVSGHATDSDFNNAAKLQGVSVSGSGQSASVAFPGSTGLREGFEDGDLSEFSGNVSSAAFEVTMEAAISGTYGLDLDASQGNENQEITRSIPETDVSGNYSVWFNQTAEGNDDTFVTLEQGGATGIWINVDRQDSISGTGDELTIGEVDGSTGIEPSNYDDIQVELYDLNFDANSGKYVVRTETQQLATGSFTFATDISAIDAITFGYQNGAGNDARVEFDDVVIPGDERGFYLSANHSAENVVEGWTNLSLSDASATVTWQGASGGAWTDVASATYSTGGNKTLALSGDYDAWRVNVTFENTSSGGAPTAELHDEGVRAETHEPAVDNSSASPSGGAELTTTPTFSINGTDVDFPTGQSDSVTLEWHRNGYKLGETTETTNGTWTFTPSTSEGGQNTWHVVATDAYGHSVTSDTFSYKVPEELRIYNETDPDQLIDSATVDIEFYFDDGSTTIVERSTTDGTVDMAGLPADQPFVVVAETNNYVSRRIYVQSLFESQSVYLLNESETFVEPVYVLEDYSGRFPAEDSVLLIQRNINESWTTVEGDFFGASGEFPAHLQYNVRHRLIVINTETGEMKNLERVTPIASGETIITVHQGGDVTIQRNAATVRVSPSIRRLLATSGQEINATVTSHDNSLDSWNVTVTYTNETTGATTTLNSTSETTASGGSFAPSLNLTGKAGGTVTVEVDYTLSSGTTGGETVEYTVARTYQNEFSLLAGLGNVANAIPSAHRDTFTGVLAVLCTLAIAGAVARVPGTSTEVIGLTGVIALAGFAVVGWIGYGPVTAGAGAWVAIAGIRRGL